MITDTDEELQQKWLDCSYTKGGVPEMLRAFLTYYIAKDRAQGQELVAQIIRNEAGQITMQSPDGKSFDMSKFIGIQLYTHAQDVAEIQAEALEKIYARYSHGISGLNLQREIAKLRKGD